MRTYIMCIYHCSFFLSECPPVALMSRHFYMLWWLLHSLGSQSGPPVQQAIWIYPCQWRAPKKRKQSTLHFADSVFEKHVYNKVKKRRLKPLEVDPRPDTFKGTAKILFQLC